MINKYKERNFYLFYIISNRGFYGTDQYDIYAFTDNKKIANNFKKTRNMKKFFCKKKKLDREEYNELIRHYMENELEMFEGTTKGKHYTIETFSLVITRREKRTCQSMGSLILNENLYQYAWGSPNVFKDKYKNALKHLQYESINLYLDLGDEFDGYVEDIVENMFPDDFNILMDQFGPTFINYKLEEDEEIDDE